jgi:hypothetical protein
MSSSWGEADQKSIGTPEGQGDNRPAYPADPSENARVFEGDGSGTPQQGSLPHGPERNCCEKKACLWAFWLFLAAFLLASFAVGFATRRPWLGALGILSVIPAVVILYFVYWRTDRASVAHSRVINIFCWGVVGAIPCALLEVRLSINANIVRWNLTSSSTPSCPTLPHNRW